MMSSRVQVSLNDETLSLSVGNDGSVTIEESGEGVPYTVDAVGVGLYRVSDGRQQWMVAVAGSGESRWVFVEGAVFEGEVIAEGRGKRRARSGADDGMAAPMPATVVKILVEPGTAVAKGETVLVLEAMKMELPIRAPRDGMIKAVKCSQGELVQPGIPLVELA